jgi:hypothetical protein
MRTASGGMRCCLVACRHNNRTQFFVFPYFFSRFGVFIRNKVSSLVIIAKPFTGIVKSITGTGVALGCVGNHE